MASQICVAESSRRRRDKGAVYQSERFGTEVPQSEEDSDTDCASCNQRNCPLPPKSKQDNWIACHSCEDWFHWYCAGVKSRKGLPEHYFCHKCKSI